MSIQSPVFAVGSVIKDVLKKNWKLWLVLQDMRKAYDLVGWHHLEASLKHIKMCDKFIKFFGSIHTDRINRVMTDFGFSDGYVVHDNLNQEEFVAKTGKIENVGRLTSFFAAGAFVDDTIWVGDCQTSTQYALNIASEAHHYLGIFLSTDGLSKSSLAKAHSDIQFFVNVVLKKAVTDKQFSYLVLAVL
ncbi:hypothetical protein G9A89_018352 [Geosiphon pyriformis]|nr:hypothetical protein G9A89_018352 [Geosiphon pyriformis]